MKLHRLLVACMLLLSACSSESPEQVAAREQQDKQAYRMREVAEKANTARIVSVGVYEAAYAVRITDHKARKGNQYGTVTVTVAAATRPVILVLSAYEPVHWIIQAEPGADVAAVLVGGYYPQEVTGINDWHVHELGQVSVDESNTNALDAAVRSWTHRAIDDYQYEYAIDAFHVGPEAADDVQ